ncbi:MAG: hypothetical protein KF758_02175 [Anaerolineales bacterium]|nr:hypothetical protein [Anaerolineales bacterium]
MKKLKQNKPLRYILGVVLFVLLCCNLPSLALCSAQDVFRPPNTEVLVSACRHPIATGVPGGETLFVHEVRTGRMYLLDLRTGEERKVPNDSLLLEKGIFLNSELVLLEGSRSRPESPGYQPDYILDLSNGKRYKILDLMLLPLKDGKFDPKNFAYFQSAENIYIHHYKNLLIALPSNFREHPENAVVISQFAFASGASMEKGKYLEKLMKDINLEYEIIDFTLYDTDSPSPLSNYIARFDGIYLTRTNQKITSGVFNYFKGWYYDDSAIIVQDGGDYLLIFPGVSSIFYVPSPILKLKLP